MIDDIYIRIVVNIFISLFGVLPVLVAFALISERGKPLRAFRIGAVAVLLVVWNILGTVGQFLDDWSGYPNNAASALMIGACCLGFTLLFIAAIFNRRVRGLILKKEADPLGVNEALGHLAILFGVPGICAIIYGAMKVSG